MAVKPFSFANWCAETGSGVDVKFTFGKYKGQTIAEVLAKDRGYLLWVRDKSDCASRTPFFHDQVKAVLAGATTLDPEPSVTDDAEMYRLKQELQQIKSANATLSCEVAQLKRDAKDVARLRQENKELEESLFALRRRQAVNGSAAPSAVWQQFYRRLAMMAHPDRGGSTELMALVNEINGKMK